MLLLSVIFFIFRFVPSNAFIISFIRFHFPLEHIEGMVREEAILGGV